MSTKTNHWSALTMPAVEIAQRNHRLRYICPLTGFKGDMHPNGLDPHDPTPEPSVKRKYKTYRSFDTSKLA